MLIYVALVVAMLLVAFAVYWFVIRNDDDEVTDTPAPYRSIGGGGTQYKVMADGTVEVVSASNVETFVGTANHTYCNNVARVYCDANRATEPPIYYMLEDPSGGEIPLTQVKLTDYPGLATYFLNEGKNESGLPDSFVTIDPSTSPPWCDETRKTGCLTRDSKRVVEIYNALFSTDSAHARANIQIARDEFKRLLADDKAPEEKWKAIDLSKIVEIDSNRKVTVNFYQILSQKDKFLKMTLEPSDEEEASFKVPMRFSNGGNALLMLIIILYIDTEDPILPITLADDFEAESPYQIDEQFDESVYPVKSYLGLT